MKTISDIINEVAEAIGGGMNAAEALTDTPLIRTALNDAIDAAVKAGEMTERAANNWSQDRAVARVRKNLKAQLDADVARALSNLAKRKWN